MIHQQKVWVARILCAVFMMLVCIPPARADIYVYIDKNRVRHFTNTPISSKYHIYLRGDVKKYTSSGSSGYKTSLHTDTTKYDNLIMKASMAHDVDFSLLKSVIKVESNFDRRAVSQKGAVGLMQIMPQNFRLLNIKNPFDPEENIMGGALYLKQMLEKFEKIELALAAYNAGPNVVDKYNGIPPISETRTYVARVLDCYRTKSFN